MCIRDSAMIIFSLRHITVYISVKGKSEMNCEKSREMEQNEEN